MSVQQQKILVVEDEDDHFELIQRGFCDKGAEYFLARAQTIAEARHHLVGAPPTLVITDWKLPDGEGVELIQADEAGDPLFPVIIMTSHGNEAWAVEAMKHGALDYIVKSVETLLDMPRSAQRALREWHNIASRKQAEETVRQKTEEVDTFFNVSLDLLCIADTEGFFRMLNPAWEKTLGFSTAELQNHRFLELVHPDDLTLSQAAVAELAAQRAVTNFVNRFRCQDGSYRWLEWRSVPVGALIYSAARDITASMEAQRLLKESEDRYRSLFEGAPDAIFLAEPTTGIILDANGAAGRLLARERAEILGLHQTELHPPGLREEARVDFARQSALACRNQPRLPTESTIIRPDGTLVPVEIVTQMVTVNGQPVLQGVFRDISQRKLEEEERERLEKRLQQAQKMESIGTLAGGIAHDFNNVLTPILGYTEIVLQRLSPDSINRESLEAVLGAGLRAKELVKQILAFSRQTEHELKPLNIYHVVKEILKLLRASIPTTIEIRQNINPDCGVVLADPTQVHQVLMNLCTNGYQAMRDQGGVLGVILTQVEILPADLAHEPGPGRYVKLEISDTGHGMAASIRERIFEPYFTTKAKGEGTGLGLAVTHGIVKSLHGHIAVHSEPGQGTTFCIYLPLVAPQGPSEQAIPLQNLVGGTERILVVDDEEVIALLEKRMLEHLGYRVTALTSSVEAWQLFQEGAERFDVIVTDVTMPEMTGLELTKRILALKPATPVIICTGFSELIDGQRAKALGASGYVMKPILIAELTKAIRVAVGDRQPPPID